MTSIDQRLNVENHHDQWQEKQKSKRSEMMGTDSDAFFLWLWHFQNKQIPWSSAKVASRNAFEANVVASCQLTSIV